MDDPSILSNIYKSKILNYIIIDYDKYENNSNVLILLNNAVKSILSSRSESKLTDKLLFELNLIQIFSTKLDSEEYKSPLSIRKDIFPFIHNMTLFISQMCEVQEQLKEKVNSEPFKPFWENMINKLNESQSPFQVEWGAANDIVVVPNDSSKDVIRKHE